MTEQEWMTSDDPQLMIGRLVKLLKDPVRLGRHVRLFCVGCCRLIWDDVLKPPHQKAVEVAELVALGLAPEDRLANVRTHLYPDPIWPSRDARAEYLDPVYLALSEQPKGHLYRLARQRLGYIADAARAYLVQLWGSRRVGPAPPDAAPPTHPWHLAFQAGVEEVNGLMADYLVCIVGNPFRSAPAFDPNWRTSTVAGLAQGIDADRAFDRMPILADALEDAGCDEASVLDHCRSTGNHARGCWVVEQVLNRTHHGADHS